MKLTKNYLNWRRRLYGLTCGKDGIMKLFEWLKWWVAPKEMEELERWRIQWHEHRRWFAEFPVAAVTLDRLKAKADGEPVTNIQVVRDSCRSVAK